MVIGIGPAYSGWFSGNEIRSASALPWTGAPSFSAKAIPASHPPARSTSGPSTSSGRSRPVDPVGELAEPLGIRAVRWLTVLTTAGPRAGFCQSSSGMDRNTGPFGSCMATA